MMIQGVLGPIDTAELGQTLMHEHMQANPQILACAAKAICGIWMERYVLQEERKTKKHEL